MATATATSDAPAAETPSAISQSAMEFTAGPAVLNRLSGAIDSKVANTLRRIVDESGTVTNSREYPSRDDKQFRLDRNYMRKHLGATFDNVVTSDGAAVLRYINPEGEIVDEETAIAADAFDDDGELVEGWSQVPHASTHRVKIAYFGKPDAFSFVLSIAERRTRSTDEDEDENGDENAA